MFDILGVNFACYHKQLGRAWVIKPDENKWGPVTLLVPVREIFEVETVWWVV